jgi:peptidoglycan/xylan/chitin deacetylase (PgdA/CDA1 family)
VNCFEPRGDVLRLLLEGALREGAHGRWVQLHTAPGPASSVVLVTHDLDAPDAFRAGPWGPPGALQAQAIEKARGVRATFDVTTDRARAGYERATIEALCADGCALGAHGVVHPASFARLPRGTCTETAASYGAAPTLCGEIRVSRAVIEEATGRAPRVWRSPNVAFHPQQLDVLLANGIPYDSSFGIGDLPQNLPVEADRASVLAMRFGRKRVLELPVALADFDLGATGAEATVARWESVVRKNAANRSFTTLLVHPSRGEGMGEDGLKVKMVALERFLDGLKNLDVATHPLEEIFDFWRARLGVKLEAAFDSRTGYTGTLVIGESTAPGITLEFADPIRELRCETCGETRIEGRRVVLVGAPAPGSRHAFVAVPR